MKKSILTSLKLKVAVLLLCAFCLLPSVLLGTAGQAGPYPGKNYGTFNGAFAQPSVSWAATGLTLTYSSGYMANYASTSRTAITAGTLTLTNSTTNYVYWISGASLSGTTTLGTAQTYSWLYTCVASGGNITGCVAVSQMTPAFGTPTGTGNIVYQTGPTLVAPALGAATYTTLGGGAVTATSLLGLTGAITPNAIGGIAVGSAALPFSGIYIGGSATNNFSVTGTTGQATVLTMPDPGGAADTFVLLGATQTLTGKTLTSPSITTDIRATTAGSGSVGTAAKPFASLILGTGATTPIYTFTPNAPSGARTIQFVDQGANGAVAFGDQSAPTKVVLLDTHGATAPSTATMAFNQAASTTLTMPIQTGGLTTAYWCGATSGSQACANTATGGTARVIGGIATLSGNSAVISAISPAFTTTSTFTCVANDLTTRANVVQVANTSTASVTITNTTGASDVINWICVGY